MSAPPGASFFFTSLVFTKHLPSGCAFLIESDPMKCPTTLLSCLATCSLVAAEIPVSPSFQSIGMFKNGLAVVRATFPVNGPGQYLWDEVPRVTHGSFWIESDGIVSVQSTSRMVSEVDEVEAATGSLQSDLAGKNVKLWLSETRPGENAMITGTVWEVPTPITPKAWDLDYSSLDTGGSNYRALRNNSLLNRQNTSTTGNFLVLDGGNGSRSYIPQNNIAAMEVAGPFQPARRTIEKPVLVFDVQKAPDDGGLVQITYLTKGLAWLPSYHLDLGEKDTMKIRQNAVVRNEMTAFNNTELQLISGFPNIRFGAVDSPLWQGTNLASFFQEINGAANSAAGNNFVSQQAVYSNFAAPAPSQALPNLAEKGNASDDIHYESIGSRSMKPGDSLSLDVAGGETTYEKVVEWKIADPRNERGRYDSSSSTKQEAWDAVRFTNPFKFPMTTAPALVVESGKFRGQSVLEWVNPGQQTCLQVTKALSIRTQASEIEEEGQREIVLIGGNDYQRTTVKGTLTIENFRNTDVTMTVTCDFSGKLIEAADDPALSLRTEGISSVNPRRQLDWSFDLPAGKEKTITYRYEVLVDR